MTPTYRSSRPCRHTHPVQKRWNDWGHGPILGMDRPKGELPIWIGLMAVPIVGVAAIIVAIAS